MIINNILKKIPQSAGIYQFFNDKKEIIYIGKSVNLKARVSSYFNQKTKLNFAKQKMIKNINDIKYILVENEVEALILETNLIKKYLPKYNILMKDGKNHLYIKITNEEFPKIIKTRFKSSLREKEIYFGPYISSFDVDNIFKILKKIFGYGVGIHNFFKNKNNYSLDEFLFNGNINLNNKDKIKKNYFEKLEKIKEVLKGNTKNIEEELKEKMLFLAKNLEFERAEIIKKQIESLNILKDKQIIRDGLSGDYDIIYFLEKFEKKFIGVLEVRDSKILGFYPYEIENILEEENEIILKKFITQKYLEKISQNKKEKINIITNEKIKKIDELIEKNFKIENPQKGIKNDLLKMCYKNIYEFAYKKYIAGLSVKKFTKQTMKNLLEILKFERFNKDILFECNDISHLSGTHTVASRSVVVNGKLEKSKYRKFKIKNLQIGEINDFDSMREIAKRRILELEKLGNFPDLIIIDGGKPQLSSVYEIFEKNKEKINFNKIQLVGIAKKEEILYTIKNNNFIEYKLKKDSPELRLIQKLRDEAHRFAITFNRESRLKESKKNILESIPGIGVKTRKKLLKNFGSIEKISTTSKEELKKILNKNQIEALENHGII